MSIDAVLREKLLGYQRDEITEHHIYRRLAATIDAAENRQVLERIAADELRHSEKWRAVTGQDVAPDWGKVWKYTLLGRVFGFTFAVKLMEKGEENAQVNMAELEAALPEAHQIMEEENQHEEALLQMLDEERLRYTGSMVLGLSDALVELTGTLAGLTLALQNTRLIALSGLITGMAAALSMGASEYLSTRTEKGDKDPLKAMFYTGGMYLVTVFLLILPYLLLDNYFVCLACSLTAALGVVLAFTYYVAVAQDEPFGQRFFEMAGLCVGVATFSFFLGYLVRLFLGVDVG